MPMYQVETGQDKDVSVPGILLTSGAISHTIPVAPASDFPVALQAPLGKSMNCLLNGWPKVSRGYCRLQPYQRTVTVGLSLRASTWPTISKVSKWQRQTAL